MRLFLLLVPSLLFGGFLHAMQASGEANKTGEVRGIVFEAASNEPIRKALVVLRKGDDPGVGAIPARPASSPYTQSIPGLISFQQHAAAS